MTKKQMKKFVEELFKCELIHQNPDSSTKEKKQTEERILSITNQIISEENGLDLLCQIDELVQKKYEIYNNNLKETN